MNRHYIFREKMMIDLTFEQGRKTDFTTLQNIQLAAGHLFYNIGMSHIAENPSTDIEGFLATIKNSSVLVARFDVNIVGFALIYRVGNDCHLEQMSVAPEHARRGFGSEILQYLIDKCRRQQLSRLTLSTFRNVPWNEPFYSKAGFRSISQNNLTGYLKAVWQTEDANGLDMTQRTIMRLELLTAKLDR